MADPTPSSCSTRGQASHRANPQGWSPPPCGHPRKTAHPQPAKSTYGHSTRHVLVNDVHLFRRLGHLQQLGRDLLLRRQHNAVRRQDTNRGARVANRLHGVLYLIEPPFGREDGRPRIIAPARLWTHHNEKMGLGWNRRPIPGSGTNVSAQSAADRGQGRAGVNKNPKADAPADGTIDLQASHAAAERHSRGRPGPGATHETRPHGGIAGLPQKQNRHRAYHDEGDQEKRWNKIPKATARLLAAGDKASGTESMRRARARW